MNADTESIWLNKNTGVIVIYKGENPLIILDGESVHMYETEYDQYNIMASSVYRDVFLCNYECVGEFE